MRRRWMIFGLCAGAYFLSQFFRSANAVLARDLSVEVGLNAAQLGLMTSLFYLSFSAVQLPLGHGLDRFGARLVTPLLMLCAVLGSALFALGDSFLVLALGRMLIGMGMAGVFMGSLKMFSRWFPPYRFATTSGYLVALGAVGSLAAGTPLAWLNQAFGWRGVFALGAGLTLASALSLLLWTRNEPPGTAVKEQDEGSGSLATVMGSLTFWRIACLDFFIVGGLLSVQGLWGGPFLFDAARLSPVAAGNLLTLLSIGALVGYIVAGSLADRLGTARVVLGGAALFVLAQAALAALALERGGAPLASEAALRIPVFVVFGFTGAFNILLMAHVRAAFPLSLTGRAVTAVNLFGIGGAFLVQWLQGLLINAFPPDAAGHYPPEAYAAAFGLTALGALAALLFYGSAYATRGAVLLRRVVITR